MKGLNHKFLLIVAVCHSCVKPYDFDSVTYDRVLVVDGVLTDEPGPHEVRLTYTYPIGDEAADQVEGATVWVESDLGEEVQYEEATNGVYLSPSTFQGTEGRSYRLHLVLGDGSAYRSEFEKLITSPPIDSIYARYAELPDETGEKNVGGLQFFIDSHDASGEARYFRYDWEETYQITVPFPAQFSLKEDSTLEPIKVPIGICYDSTRSSNLIYGTTVGSQENRMVEFPIRFVSQETQLLRDRYTILVRQFAISESAYFFYKRLRENNESGGSFFDKQTGTILGNISSVEDSDLPVLGFFEVSGVTRLRRFFNPRRVDKRLKPADFPYRCLAEESMEGPLDSVWLLLNEYRDYHVWFVYYPPNPEEVPIAYIQSKTCTDCTWYASNVKPTYWED